MINKLKRIKNKGHKIYTTRYHYTAINNDEENNSVL